MGLWGRFGVLVARFLSFSTLSPFDGADQPQTPLGLVVPAEYIQAESVVVPPPLGPNVADNPLVFRPPGHRQGNGDGFEFQCNYTAMGDKWAKCSKPDRTCWLQNKETLERYDIYTDYENKYPNGTIREYWLDVTKSNITADGYTFFGATVFNNSYPGPWIQACWGDTVRIHVRNLDPDRGTSVHVSLLSVYCYFILFFFLVVINLNLAVARDPTAQLDAYGWRKWRNPVPDSPREQFHV
jgi:hypothetical protein